MLKTKKYLFVTGASGFIGNSFINKAVKRGYKIFAISRKKKKNKSNNIKWIKGDLHYNYDKYLKKTDIFVHFASAGVNKKKLSFREAFEVNVLKSYKLLNNCLKNGCKKWIIISSASEYGKSATYKKELNINTLTMPESNYEISKNIFSNLVMSLSNNFNVKARIMRIFNVYGRGENKNKLLSSLNNALKFKKNYIVTSSNQKKDFINVNDVNSILIDSLNFKKNCSRFPQIWHVASGNSMTVKDFIISKFKKKDIKKVKFKNTNKFKRHFISSKNSLWKF